MYVVVKVTKSLSNFYINLKLTRCNNIFLFFDKIEYQIIYKQLDIENSVEDFEFFSKWIIYIIYRCNNIYVYIYIYICTKNEEFWSVRFDMLGVRQNSLMI